METSTWFILGVLTVGFIAEGINYGLQILHAPTDTGWTWSSVATGFFHIVWSQFMYGLIFSMFYRLDLLTFLIAIIAGGAVHGIPMAAFQIYKKVSARRLENRIKKTRNFNEE